MAAPQACVASRRAESPTPTPQPRTPALSMEDPGPHQWREARPPWSDRVRIPRRGLVRGAATGGHDVWVTTCRRGMKGSGGASRGIAREAWRRRSERSGGTAQRGARGAAPLSRELLEASRGGRETSPRGGVYG
jgi:hypothetical protein